MTKKVRSKANPRSLVFTIGFSAGVVGLAMAKGPKPTRKPMRNRYSLTPNRARHPLGVPLRTLTKGVSSAPGDSDCYRRLGEISRSRSLGDKSPKHREKTMKIRAVVILVGLAISFALPIFAQEKEDVKPFPFTPIPAGPQLVQQIEAINQEV